MSGGELRLLRWKQSILSDYDGATAWKALEAMDEQVGALNRIVRAFPDQWKKALSKK